MNVKCQSFLNNEMIPKKFTGYGEDISPEFIIEDIPEGTVSFAIILDDLDVPLKKNYNHWIVWNIPKMEIIPGELPKGGIINKPITACQGNAWGKQCYRGRLCCFLIVLFFYVIYARFPLFEKKQISMRMKKNERSYLT